MSKLSALSRTETIREASKHNIVPADSPGETSVQAEICATPQELRDASDRLIGHIKVECAVRLHGHLVIVGWAVGAVTLLLDDPMIETSRVKEFRFPRPDVASHFGRPGSEEHGFALIAPSAGVSTVGFGWRFGGKSTFAPLPLDVSTSHSALEQALPCIAASLTSAYAPFSEEWSALVELAMLIPTKEACGFLEAAAVFEGGKHAVLTGWVVANPGTTVWIQDSHGSHHPLEGACWRARPDVHEAIGGRFGAPALQSGFVTLLECPDEVSRFRLMALSPDGLHVLGEVKSTAVDSEPRAASRWLFGIDAPTGGLQQRFDKIGHPLLSGLIKKSQQSWSALPIVHRQCGTGPVSPEVSIVVPLHGRFDFVESQLLEWARDVWVRQRAQLIYVIDDPSLVERFHAYAEELFQLYGLAFEWVWGGVNRGFSGANNLGASVANAPYLLFLNSDVFPQEPGWLPALVEVLEARNDVGVVAPRLLFAEGGIQHAGMTFQRLEQYGVWINRHPFLGLAPELDPARELAVVPAVTGACMLLRRRDFDAVGGWDTGYLIGDFEDSDLCLKLRAKGLASAYLPAVQLTHLERQSMRNLGSEQYRMRVTLWNALRHQHRWSDLLALQHIEANA